MSDPKYQHGSSEDGWMEQNDTPRTDAIEFRHCPPQPKELLKKHEDAYALSRELERELAASQADVAKLNHQLLKTENDLLQSQDINSFLDAEFRIACKRAEKAEAEVERLDHLLADASETNHKLGVEVMVLRSLRTSPSIEWHKKSKVKLK